MLDGGWVSLCGYRATQPPNGHWRSDVFDSLVARRFWSKVSIKGQEECWPWTAGFSSRGYGRFRSPYGSRTATHTALYLDGRPRPSEMHFACHSCNNPPCCNPKHLRWGLHQDNMNDRASRGAYNKPRRMTKEQKALILSWTGTTKELMRLTGFSQSHISQTRIRNGVLTGRGCGVKS